MVSNSYEEAINVLNSTIYKNIKHVSSEKQIYIKNKHCYSYAYSRLQIKRSATNIFVTFVVNGCIIFSCTAGSAGMKKKERRWRHAAFQAGKLFGNFASEYIKRRKARYIFNRIIAVLKAPASFLRMFFMACKDSIMKRIWKINKKSVKKHIHGIKNIKEKTERILRTFRQWITYAALRKSIVRNAGRMYGHILTNSTDLLHVPYYKNWAQLCDRRQRSDNSYSNIRSMAFRSAGHSKRMNGHGFFFSMYKSKCLKQWLPLRVHNVGSAIRTSAYRSFSRYFSNKYTRMYDINGLHSALIREYSMSATNAQHHINVPVDMYWHSTALHVFAGTSYYNNRVSALCNAVFARTVSFTKFIRKRALRITWFLSLTKNCFVSGYVKKRALNIAIQERSINNAYSSNKRIRMSMPHTISCEKANVHKLTYFAHGLDNTSISVYMHAYIRLSGKHNWIYVHMAWYYYIVLQHIHYRVGRLFITRSLVATSYARVVRKMRALTKTLRSMLVRNKRYNMSRFRVFMYNDQNTFPFNGCRGKRKRGC